jgi:RHS repeat-associated protein
MHRRLRSASSVAASRPLLRRLAVWCLALMLMPAVARAQAPAETTEYYGQDAVGSIRIVFDVSGTVLARQDYAPFGKPLFSAPAMPKEGFGAQQTDAETDQSYFHARMFEARTGRFTRPDPIQAGLFEPQLLNRYAYARNSPLAFSDFDGLDPVTFKSGTVLCNDFQNKAEPGYAETCPAQVVGTANGPGRFPTGTVVFGLGGWGGGHRPQNGEQRRPPGAVIGPTPVTPDTPLNGVTVTFGINVPAVGGFGVTGSTGVVVGSTGCPGGGVAAGGFGSGGFDVGADASASITVGVYHEGIAQLRGTRASISASHGIYTGTLQFDSAGRLVGASVGLGMGIGGSAGPTGTGVVVVGKGMAWSGTCQ